MILVIKNGPLVNQTLSTVKFNYYGTPTDYKTIICDNWQEGFLKARSLNCQFALFVSAGTVFEDIDVFLSQLLNFPHQGLIGHIIDPRSPDRFFYLDEQCFFLDLNKFNTDDLEIVDFYSADPLRSEIDLHDDYTPLWIKNTNGQIKKWSGSEFGEKLLAKQIIDGMTAINWSNSFRGNKKFLYTGQDIQNWMLAQQKYLSVAENQLWVFNNETIPIATEQTLVSPASGLCWIKNLVSSVANHITLIDISEIQLGLAKNLWEHWDGENYGQFVFDYIKQNNVIHFNLDQPTMSEIDRIKLKSSKIFVGTVNEIFQQQMIDVVNFKETWKKIKQTKTVEFNHGDAVKFLPDYITNCDSPFNLWMSNILDYKYTLIKNTKQDYERFTSALDNVKVVRIYG